MSGYFRTFILLFLHFWPFETRHEKKIRGTIKFEETENLALVDLLPQVKRKLFPQLVLMQPGFWITFQEASTSQLRTQIDTPTPISFWLVYTGKPRLSLLQILHKSKGRRERLFACLTRRRLSDLPEAINSRNQVHI